ncbi:hypothetical protein DL770_007623 [Monosporascus sp. CRB-9-2]|nr:hypothetical protein DL770_007623 [Monosporascus sp. CRB-9-2]
MASLKKLLALLSVTATIGSAIAQNNSTEWPVHDNGLTDIVQWDHYSFFVNGQRLFVFSGELHYWRYPVPELWRDLLEKVRAAGFNAFSIYNHWGWHNPVPGVLDFESGAHDFTTLLTLAKELGMYVIIRPGPYINAEANAGGFPLWVTTGAYGGLRDNDPRYTEAWTPYMTEMAKVVKPHLITNGGNAILYQIENEYSEQWLDIKNRFDNVPVQEYFELMKHNAWDNGIDVPLMHNAPNMRGYSWSKDFSDAKGNVDVVGLDSYPSCWSCNLSECTGTNGVYVPYKTQNYYDYFTVQSPTQPNFMPEFQGGSYNPWGGPQGGCPGDIGADFANIFYRNLIYQRVSAVNLYMLFGGTSWGWHAAPVVATSYDYSSPISESRSIGSKYYETKLLTQFTRVARDLAMTDRLGNDTTYTNNPAITTAELRNPETGAAFYVVMHADSTSSTRETFKLDIETSGGELTVPQYGGDVTINGHQAKILVTDFKFGSKTLLYSTAEVLTYAVIDGKEVLVLWVPTGESGEFTVSGVRTASMSSCNGCANVGIYSGRSNVTVTFTQNAGKSIVTLGDGSKVVLLDRSAAYLFWSPNLSDDPMAPANSSVRSAAIDGRTLHLTGDVANSTAISVFAPKSVRTITWNGKNLKIASHKDGVVTAEIKAAPSFKLPRLGGWKQTNGLPEIANDYDTTGEAWITADNFNTTNPTKPAANNPVLYVDDYGIHTGAHIYRATFPTTSEPPTGVYVNAVGGLAFGYSAWLNSQFIGSWLGRSWLDEQGMTFSFSNVTLNAVDAGEDNVLVIVMDNSGHDQRAAALNPRGIKNATLVGPSGDEYAFREWKIAGAAGLGREPIDPVRGILNEGRFYAERVGLHLPGAPEAEFEAAATGDDILQVEGAGVGVFRTVVPLDVPKGLDVSISFRLTAPSDETFVTATGKTNQLRALLFVNGYQYGRFNPYIGHQIDFPVPPGILNYNGDNTIVVNVWSQSADGAEMKVEWKVDYVHDTSYDMAFDASYLRPEWSEERLDWA